MEADMDNYIHQQNLANYRKLLAETMEEPRRRQLLKALAEEEAKGQFPPATGEDDDPGKVGP
jgi:hypothetical protein